MTAAETLESSPSLADLLQPTTPEEFFEEYWEKRRLHLSRRRPGFYDAVFSLADVDRWLAAAGQSANDSVRVKATGGESFLRSGRPGDIPVEALYEDFAAGHSIILHGIQESWAPLQPLIADLEEATSARVKVNLYLSPAGSKVFPRHVDYHGFFIFQLDGAKDWFLYDYDYLPVERLEYGACFRAFKEATTRDSPLREQLRLEAGDLLYVPRGMPHMAAAADSPSLHLTVSFHPLYWMDFLKTAVEEVCIRDESLQKALPPGFLSAPEKRERMPETFAAVVESFCSKASFAATLEAILKRQIATPRNRADGHFAQLARPLELTLDSQVERRRGVLCRLEPAGEQVAIRFGAGQVRGPAKLRPALDFVCGRRHFTLRELPGLDDKGRLVLARRLIRSGLLRQVTS